MSLEGLALLLLVVLVLLAIAAWHGHRATQQLALFEQQLRRAEAAGKELSSRLEALEALRDAQQLTEHAIATGTAVVKEVHRGIADIPFSVFEAIPATAKSAKALRGLHDSISEGVYGALAGLNKAVGRELRKGVPVTEAPVSELPVRVADGSEVKALDAPDDATPAQPQLPDGKSKSWG